MVGHALAACARILNLLSRFDIRQSGPGATAPAAPRAAVAGPVSRVRWSREWVSMNDRPVPEAQMPRPSPQFTARTAPTLTLCTAILFGVVPACARRSPTTRPEPEVAAVEDTITAADMTSAGIEKRHQEPVGSLLQARTSGVEVTVLTDGSLSLRVRGASSFQAGTEPLIVVDGTPLSPGSGGTLRGINPNDIESITVLKNPGDTALYGMRGANGVIVVTTKRPLR